MVFFWTICISLTEVYDATLCRSVSSYRRFEKYWFLHFQGLTTPRKLLNHWRSRHCVHSTDQTAGRTSNVELWPCQLQVSSHVHSYHQLPVLTAYSLCLLARQIQWCDFQCINLEAINRTGITFRFFPTCSIYPNLFAVINLYDVNLLISQPAFACKLLSISYSVLSPLFFLVKTTPPSLLNIPYAFYFISLILSVLISTIFTNPLLSLSLPLSPN
jgi:hypothetical protein